MTYEIMRDLAKQVRATHGARITNATYKYSGDKGLSGHLFVVPERGINPDHGRAGILEWRANKDGSNPEIIGQSWADYGVIGALLDKWEDITAVRWDKVVWTLFQAIYEDLDAEVSA